MSLPEITLAELSEFDIHVLADHSGSTGAGSTRFQGKNRWQEMAEMAVGLAGIAEKVDEDGITLIPFSTKAVTHDGVKAAAVAALFESTTPYGTTNLADAIRQSLAKAAASGKKTIAIVFTDGAPNSEDEVEQVIVAAARTQKTDDAYTLLFVQVGNDAGATAFLKKLDDGLKDKHNLPFDIVDTVPLPEAESLTPGQLLHKAIHD